MPKAFQGIVDARVRLVVQAMEGNEGVSDRLVGSLVSAVAENAARPEVRARYEDYRNGRTYPAPGHYPMQGEYALSFDPLEDEEAFWNCWTRYGFVVGRQVVRPALLSAARDRIRSLVMAMSGGACDIEKAETHDNMPKDEYGVPLVSRGFLEVYHDDSLAQLRQSVRAYLHHAVIWGRADLWTSFDRYGLKLAGHVESAGLPLHVDQNPTVHPFFETVQGVLALGDCPAERGTFVAVPGSASRFSEYAAAVASGYRGEYVELARPLDVDEVSSGAQLVPLRAGDIVSWDSRTTHGNSANRSGQSRMVAYISAGPARNERNDLVKARLQAFSSGIGTNVRDARMHASKKPRYTSPESLEATRAPERLTRLGRLLYGLEDYPPEAPGGPGQDAGTL